jgi:two-component system sensor histidine kinase/response regulator
MHKILVINNDIDTMSLLKGLLERDSTMYKVEYTGNKKEALNIINEFDPEIILIDILQKDVLYRLKKDPVLSTIPVILMTGYLLRDQAIELQVDDVIEKPFTSNALEYKILAQLQKAG